MRLRDDKLQGDRKGGPLGLGPFPCPPAVCIFGPQVTGDSMSQDSFLLGQVMRAQRSTLFSALKPLCVKTGTSVKAEERRVHLYYKGGWVQLGI